MHVCMCKTKLNETILSGHVKEACCLPAKIKYGRGFYFLEKLALKNSVIYIILYINAVLPE